MPVHRIGAGRQRFLKRNNQLCVILLVTLHRAGLDLVLLRVRHHHAAEGRLNAFREVQGNDLWCHRNGIFLRGLLLKMRMGQS